MADRTCSIDGCENEFLARGWCATHYTRWHKYGDPHATPRFDRKVCSVDGCDKRAEKRGWCGAHYRRWRKHGSVLEHIPIQVVAPGAAERRCNGPCDRTLPAEAFTKYRSGTCRECVRLSETAWRKDNADYFRRWRRDNPDKVAAGVHKRRATREGRAYERVSRAKVFERDDFTCQLCGDRLEMDAPRWHPKSPTIDHIVPLSTGGDHLYSNIQAACFRCNTSKGNRTHPNTPLPD